MQILVLSEMGRILVILVALFVLLVAHGTDASRSYLTSQEVNAKFHAPIDGTKSIRPFIDQLSPHLDHHATWIHSALHGEETAPNGYYGLIATMDVYGFSLTPGQGTMTEIALVHTGNGLPTHLGGIIVGWNVLPPEYGDSDSRTHFYTLWTDDGFARTGCLDMKCPGFQPEKGAAMAPGDVIEHVSDPKGAKQNLTLKIVKDGASGDWLVHAGLNRDPELIGRFPGSLFHRGFADRATAVRLGGFSTDQGPMGSGYLPAAGGRSAAASISNIHLIDRNGRASPVTKDLPKQESEPKDYAVSPIVNGRFFYGGPRKPTA